MGVVFRARDENLERDVALKVLPPGLLTDESARSRFRKEALALSRLNHPNVAAVYDFGSENGSVVLAMQFVDGESARSTVEEAMKLLVTRRLQKILRHE